MDYDERQQFVATTEEALQKNRTASRADLQAYLQDRPEDLRRDLYALYWRLSTAAPPQLDPSSVVDLMLANFTGETPLLRGQMAKWLQDYRKGDFTPQAIILLEALPWTGENETGLIRVCGIAGAPAGLIRLRRQVQEHPLPDSPSGNYYGGATWAALLALARTGDGDALARVIRQVRRENNLVVRDTILFPDLGYTQQPAAFDLLREFLGSTARLPQVKDSMPGRMEAVCAAEVLARHAVGFPIRGGSVSEPQLAEVQRWAGVQREWRFR